MVFQRVFLSGINDGPGLALHESLGSRRWTPKIRPLSPKNDRHGQRVARVFDARQRMAREDIQKRIFGD
jgi:hypothetical protein